MSALPVEAIAAMSTLGIEPGALRERVKPGPPRPLERWSGEDVLVDVARGLEGRRLIELELEGRRWAAKQAIPVPDVLASAPDGTWIVSRRIHGTSCSGTDAVKAALVVADEILESPRVQGRTSPSAWRGSRRTMLVRVVRSTAGGLSLPAYRAAREQAWQLDDKAMAHGDFYRRNVLVDDRARIWLIDWEFFTWHPRWTDHVRLWSTLTRPDDRAVVVRHLEATVPARRHQHVAVLVRYLTLRLLAENLAAPPRWRNADDLTHARAMVAEGAGIAGSLCG